VVEAVAVVAAQLVVVMQQMAPKTPVAVVAAQEMPQMLEV
jgi:hypothetical protein